MVLKKDSNGEVIQVAKLPKGTVISLDSGTRTSTALTAGIYILNAIGNTYYKGFGSVALADAEDVTSSGATLGAYLKAGDHRIFYIEAGEVVKIDAAGDLQLEKVG